MSAAVLRSTGQSLTLDPVYRFIKNYVCASGASAVAIDNKIEQAMDLVKSHLMFAVREEVEVLKEKIAELMERITQLESENTVLRASANPDTLAQLSSTQSSQASNPP
uniref:TSC22 domain family protein 3 n=2 Tax=Lygus hesperus TaxID=30085 RepID=A0A0A9X6X2_LYGHE